MAETKVKSKYAYARYIWLGAYVLMSGFIIFLAASSGEESAAQSGFVLDTLLAVLSWFDYVPTPEITETLAYLIRKAIGHFGFFLVDGVFAYMTYHYFIKTKKTWLPLLIASAATLALAGISETIQLFASGRTGMLSDVIIDMAGAMIGISLTYWIANRTKKENQS